MKLLRLHQGNCFDYSDDIENDSIALIFTDPPYGNNNNDGKDLASVHERAIKARRHKFWNVARDGDHGAPRPIKNDGQREADDAYRRILRWSKKILTSDGVICVCCGGGGPNIQYARWSSWMEKYISFKQMIVWDKGKMGMGWHYRRSYEVVLVGTRSSSKCAWYDNTNKIENVIRPGDYGIRKIIPSSDQHPTEKPVALAAHFIRLHTKPGDVVFDPFMGSGSTGEAALRLGRKFIGIELDAEHFDKASTRIRRVEKEMKNTIFSVPVATSKKKKRIVGGFFSEGVDNTRRGKTS